MPLKKAQHQLALDVMTNAVEGVIGYWTINREVARHDGVDGEHVTLIRFEEKDESTQRPVEPRVVYAITPEKVIAAMERIAVERLLREDIHKTITFMWATDDYLAGEGGDGTTDDAIIQVAAFGEVRYG